MMGEFFCFFFFRLFVIYCANFIFDVNARQVAGRMTNEGKEDEAEEAGGQVREKGEPGDEPRGR